MNVLDHGEISVIGQAPDGNALYMQMYAMYKGHGNPALLDMATLILKIKAPIFVCLYLSQFVDVYPSKNDSNIETFVPTIAEIGAKNIETSHVIATSIAQSIDTQISNVEAYRYDGCDTHIAQLVLPISTYATYIMSGSVSQWLKVCGTQNTAMPIEEYKKAILLQVRSEYATVIDKVAADEPKRR